jgi:high-affinity nickel-transport protein
MSLVDSLDSVLMLYAYAPLRRDSPDGRLTLFCELKVPPACEPREPLPDTEVLALVISQDAPSPVLLVGMSNEADPRDEHPPSDQAKVPTDSALCDSQEDAGASAAETIIDESVSEDYRARRMLDAKASTMSSLSITLTVLSILVALR